jgi:hypothetical protein
MRTSQAEVGRFPVTEAEETTKDWAAYSVTCPECGEPAGFRCIYTTEVRAFDLHGYSRTHVRPHRIGDMTIRPHHARSNVVAERDRRARLLAARREAGPPGPAWPGEETRKIRAALAAFDLDEYERMRDWLKNYGEILWRDQRPDGTFRGETYAFG